jgi:hypothetical protein
MTLRLRESATSTPKSAALHRRRRRRRSDPLVPSDSGRSDEEYRVGPGRPPREYQFKPGQSGNSRGAKRKTSLAPDLKAILERALTETVTLRRGERDQIITKAAAGIATLVDQYVGGDRHARRDLIALAKELGVDLTAGQRRGIENTVAEAITANDEAIIIDFLRRHGVQPEQYRASRIDLTTVKEDTDKVNAPKETS